MATSSIPDLNGQLRLITDAASVGTATTKAMGEIYTDLPLNAIYMVNAAALTNATLPSSYGNVIFIKGSNAARGCILFLGKDRDAGIAYMGLSSSTNAPDGTWHTIIGSVSASKLSFNNSKITDANFKVYQMRIGNTVTIRGSFTTTYEIPTFTNICTVSAGFRPSGDVGVLMYDYTNTTLHFGFLTVSNGEISTQKTAIPANATVYIIPLTYLV